MVVFNWLVHQHWSPLLLSTYDRVSAFLSKDMTLNQFLSREQKDKLVRFPKTASDLREMNEVLQFYMEDHFWLVIIAYTSIFIK